MIKLIFLFHKKEGLVGWGHLVGEETSLGKCPHPRVWVWRFSMLTVSAKVDRTLFGYIDVGDGCWRVQWRRFILVTTCHWQLWEMLMTGLLVTDLKSHQCVVKTPRVWEVQLANCDTRNVHRTMIGWSIFTSHRIVTVTAHYFTDECYK